MQNWIFRTVKDSGDERMVLGHQNLLANMSGSPPGLQPALALAQVAAHLAPRSRPWAPFLQFGMPMFAPFLTRPHFGGHPQHNLLNISNMSNSTSNSSHSSNLSSQRNLQSPPSEDSNDERGEKLFLLVSRQFLVHPSVFIKCFSETSCLACSKLMSILFRSAVRSLPRLETINLNVSETTIVIFN